MYIEGFIIYLFNLINENKINIISTLSKCIVLFGVLAIISTLILIIITYYVFKLLNIKYINSKNCLVDYNNTSKYYLKKYGDCPIKKAYLIKYPVAIYCRLFFKFIHLDMYNAYDNYFHYLMLFEIELPNKVRKFVYVSKEPGIYISSNYYNTDEFKLIPIKIKQPLKNTELTLCELLLQTRLKMGTDMYHNWHIYSNNCQSFVQNMLQILNVRSKKVKLFMNQQVETTLTTDLTLHIIENVTNIISYAYSML